MKSQVLKNAVNVLLSIKIFLLFIDGIIRFDISEPFRLHQIDSDALKPLPPFIICIMLITTVALHTMALYSVNSDKPRLLIIFLVYSTISLGLCVYFQLIPEVGRMDYACSSRILSERMMCKKMIYNVYTDMAIVVIGAMLLIVLVGYYKQTRNSEGIKARAEVCQQNVPADQPQTGNGEESAHVQDS